MKPADAPKRRRYARRCPFRILGTNFHAWCHEVTVDELKRLRCMHPPKMYVESGIMDAQMYANYGGKR